MTASSGNQLSVGAKFGVLFELNSSGYPDATSVTVPYEGIELAGIKGFELSSPNARMITHTGNDRVLAVDFLPTQEPISGEIRIAPSLMTVNASVMGVTAFTVGEAKMLPWATDKQGSEEDFGLIVYQQSLDKDTKLRAWRGVIAPRIRAVPVLSPMNDNPSEFRYQVIASPSTKHLWGTALATGTEGATEAAALETMGSNKPKVVAWLGNASATSFSLPSNFPAVSTAKMIVWVNGVLNASSNTTTAITPAGGAPASGAIIVCWYERA